MSRSILAGGAAAVAVALLVAGCSNDAPNVVEAYGDPGSTHLELGVDTCNRHPKVTAVESADEVRLTVTADKASRGGADDCQDGAHVTLKQPLDDRRVVDDATGEVIDVQPSEQ